MSVEWEIIAYQTSRGSNVVNAVHWKIYNSENNQSFYGVTDISHTSQKTLDEITSSGAILSVKFCIGETDVQNYESIVTNSQQATNITPIGGE